MQRTKKTFPRPQTEREKCAFRQDSAALLTLESVAFVRDILSNDLFISDIHSLFDTIGCYEGDE